MSPCLISQHNPPRCHLVAQQSGLGEEAILIFYQPISSEERGLISGTGWEAGQHPAVGQHSTWERAADGEAWVSFQRAARVSVAVLLDSLLNSLYVGRVCRPPAAECVP